MQEAFAYVDSVFGFLSYFEILTNIFVGKKNYYSEIQHLKYLYIDLRNCMTAFGI